VLLEVSPLQCDPYIIAITGVFQWYQVADTLLNYRKHELGMLHAKTMSEQEGNIVFKILGA
jgi:hypothetical protein